MGDNELSGVSIVTNDWHVPFHDKYAFRLFLRVVANLQPRQVIINGDAADCYAISFFDKNPDRMKDSGFQVELDQFGELVTDLNAAKPADCTVHYLPGNHEDRLRRFLWSRAAGLADLRALQLESLLGLDDLGVTYHEHEFALTTNLVAKHGRFVRKAAGQSAHAELQDEKFSVSTITGHVHRIGQTMVRTRHGVVGGWECGCLCSIEPEYMRRPDWQQGIIAVRTFANSDSFAVEQIPFLGGGASIKAVVNGHVIRL